MPQSSKNELLFFSYLYCSSDSSFVLFGANIFESKFSFAARKAVHPLPSVQHGSKPERILDGTRKPGLPDDCETMTLI